MYSKSTVCVHQGTIKDKQFGGAISPVYTTTSYRYLDTEDLLYPRNFNTPNQEVIEKKISKLENAQAGLLLSSGMAAISTTLMTFLKKGDHALFQKGLYGGTFKLIVNELENFGIEYSIIEKNNIEDFKKAIKENTKIIYIETPSNPLLGITDISAVSELARSENIISIMDNTFATPINQNPIDLGIDIVIHSATKYIGGHSDICSGITLSSEKYINQIRSLGVKFGGSLNAITCYLLERSIKTLAIRVDIQNNNAMLIAEYLNKHPKMKKVYYPGLKSHVGHEIAQKQMKGFGGMLSFEVRNINVVAFLKKLRLIQPSMSLGGVETIICAPSETSHKNLDKTQKEKAGINDSQLRISVGIENVNDIIADLEQAL